MSEENKDSLKQETQETQEAPEKANTAPAQDVPEEETKKASCPETAQPKETTKKEKKSDKELEKLRQQADKVQKDLEQTKDLLLRTAAEYDNYRKRTEREKQNSIGFGTANAVEKLLPVLDSLELAAQAETADEAYKKGVLMTLKMFDDALKGLGVEEIAGVGTEFDPHFHCAVAREASEGFESGTVVKVMRKGYRMGDRVVRISMVTVAE